jgi:hypothetical protein
MNATQTTHNRRKAMKFKITYRGKEYTSRGENCEEAMERFAGRKVFGGGAWIGKYLLVQYDADTRGHRWAEFVAGWNSEYRVMVETATDGT